ncbi:MAG: class I adenylate-forming enzyme family protein [Myxococcota bacterium]|nr:class I adenylate-forming enzyme family protein [Myxococcota bacterium]
MPSYEEAVAAVTGPGSPFEIAEAEIGGQKMKTFKNAPPSLRALFGASRAKADQEFLIYEDERWTFGKVMEHVDALGSLLVTQYGVEPGDTVAIAMRNYPEWIVAFAAITSVGAISVSFNAWWTAEEMDYAIGDCGAKVLICDIERLTRAAETETGKNLKALVVRAPEGDLPAPADRYEAVLPLGSPLPEVEITPDMDATILYTSGTTGFPKGAVSTHRAVLSALLAFGCRTAVQGVVAPKDRESEYPTSFILAVPLFHVTGCVAVMLSCFAAGLKLVIMYKWGAERALELIERERITNFVGVPTMSWDLLESPDFASRDTSSLGAVGGGGAPAPPELVERVEKGFEKGRPGIGYGMTETNAYGPQNSGDDYLRKPTSSGRLVPIVEMRATDDAGNTLPVGEVGELWFRGPNLIRGYWNKPEATAETIVDGWLRSGDIGRIDEEGFVFVMDRAKDMVLRAGENVYCAEVEAVIYKHPAVYEAAVFGLPHDRLGEEVAVAVLPKEGTSLDPSELQAFVKEHLAPFKVPSHVQIATDALPRNAAGKFLKRQLRDEIVASRGGA